MRARRLQARYERPDRTTARADHGRPGAGEEAYLGEEAFKFYLRSVQLSLRRGRNLRVAAELRVKQSEAPDPRLKLPVLSKGLRLLTVVSRIVKVVMMIGTIGLGALTL